MTFRVPYATFADYSPKGTSAPSVKSQKACIALKQAKPDVLEAIATALQQPEAINAFSDFFGPNVTLVPAPRSSPLGEGHLWPGLMIAQKLVEAGLAQNVLPCLKRIEPVPKSHLQVSGQRPDVQKHYDTMMVEPQLLQPAKIILIDDVISIGRTVFAGAMRLQEAFPNTEIRVFGILRTRGFIPEITAVRNFIVSEIIESGGGGCRRIDPET